MFGLDRLFVRSGAIHQHLVNYSNRNILGENSFERIP